MRTYDVHLGEGGVTVAPGIVWQSVIEDSVQLADTSLSTGLLSQFALDRSDTVSITDVVSVELIAGADSRDVVDALTLSEILAMRRELVHIDNMALTETLTLRRQLGLSDNAVLTDSVVASLTQAPPSGSLLLGHVPGKFYFGWSTSHAEGSGAGTAETQLNTQTPFSAAAPSGPAYSSLLGVRRLYSKDTSTINWIDSQNRVLWISAKGPELGASSTSNWAQLGGFIAGFDPEPGVVAYFTSLVARNKLTIFTFHHEPIGDDPNNGNTYCAAFRNIMQIVDANFPGHKIVFCPNYEENRLLRNLNNGTINWAEWVPASMMPGKGGPRPWDFISFDIYQYGADTTSTPLNTDSVYFSRRWPTIEAFFTGSYVPNGTNPADLTHLRYTIGVDLMLGIGEGSARPGAFYNWQNNLGSTSQRSNLTGAKYARDYLNWVFNNPTHFYAVSWFNSIGADLTYNDERLFPDTNTWGNKTPNHPSLVQQTGDTEYSINVYREKLLSGIPIKLGNNGLPA